MINVVIVSDFYPQQKKRNIHAGLLEAVTYRLKNPTHYIILLSFFSKEELIKYDTFGILSLQGTEFIRLPFMQEELYTTIEKYINIVLSFSKEEWVMFSTNAYKTLLKEKIRMLNHGSQYEFGSFVTIPLRAACVGSFQFPTLLPVIIERLQSIKLYIAQELVSEFLSMANMAC